MIHLDMASFDEVYGPAAHVSTVLDIGAIRVDLDHDQPPYTGLVLALEHRELIGSPFTQFFKVPDDKALELFHLLGAHIANAGIDQGDHHGQP